MLLDFNLCAEAAEPVPPLGGTVPYMAPEQLHGMELDEASPFDARSDIFSLGVILYELMTEPHPFGPVNLKLGTSDLRQHLLERQRRGSIEARTVNRDVDAAVSRLIQRCLAFDPEKRPQTAAEIAAALRTARRPPDKRGAGLAAIVKGRRRCGFLGGGQPGRLDVRRIAPPL